jgi:benzylsuccinate CoA-transferase BbsF subunit
MSDQAPLHGVRVIELGTGIAAPVAARTMAEFGADVIRVESLRRPDSLRASAAGWVPPGYDQSIRQDTMAALSFASAGKRSLGLEVDTPAGYSILAELVATADVFMTNLAADVLPRLGISYEAIRAIRPDIVYISFTAFGDSGPYRSYRTWGQNLSAISGIDNMLGWPDRDAVQVGFAYPDYVSAQTGSVAILAALDRRDRTGEGCHIELNQYLMALNCIAPAIVEVGLRGSSPSNTGNRREGRAPHGLYPCRGNDRWVALSVLDDAMWQALGNADGLASLANDPRFATIDNRSALHDEIDEHLCAWTSVRTDWDAAAELQYAGVAAAPVLDAWDVLVDEQLTARYFYRVLPSARFGADLCFGSAVVMPDTPIVLPRAAPAMGEDTRDVLAELGHDAADTRRLLKSGVASAMTRTDVHLERPYLHWIDKMLCLPWPTASFDPARHFMANLPGPDTSASDRSTGQDGSAS